MRHFLRGLGGPSLQRLLPLAFAPPLVVRAVVQELARVSEAAVPRARDSHSVLSVYGA